MNNFKRTKKTLCFKRYLLFGIYAPPNATREGRHDSLR